MALLSGARNEKNNNLAKQVFDRMKTLFPQLKRRLKSAGTLLANLYGSIGDIEQASNIRAELDEMNVKKKVGVSCIITNGQFYVSS